MKHKHKKGATHHVGGPAKLSSDDEDTRRVGDTVGDNNLLDVITKGILDGRAKVIELRSLGLTDLLLLVGLLKL